MKKSLVILTVYIQLISAVSHSLQYIYTAVTPGINFPEFTAVGLVDEEQIDYYDSYIRKLIPKTVWIKEIDNDDPEYWNTGTWGLQANQEVFKANVGILMQRFNQTKGFFPKAVKLFWQKNGEDLKEDVELRETLPNQDGTFQKRSILTVSPEELNKHHYTCIIQHSSLEEKMVLQEIDLRVLSGDSDGGSAGIFFGGAVVVLLIVLSGCAGFIIWKNSGD
ncbi:hypothetical protein MHYP_G00260480 [Metynnis hypsauchen]